MLVPSGIHAKYPIPRTAQSLRNPRFSRVFHLKNHPLNSTKTQFFLPPDYVGRARAVSGSGTRRD